MKKYNFDIQKKALNTKKIDTKLLKPVILFIILKAICNIIFLLSAHLCKFSVIISYTPCNIA